MLVRYLALLIFIPIISGCAGISYSEFQDADSLGDGHSALTAGFSMGFEGRYQFAVSDKADIGISLWSINIINPFKDDQDIGLKLNWKQLLSGKESKHKIAVTTSGFVYTSSYKDRSFIDGPITIMNDVSYNAWGVSPGIIYSYTFDKKNPEIDWPGNFRANNNFSWFNPRSFYAGIKINYFSSSTSTFYRFDSTETNQVQKIVFPMPFFGLTVGEDELQYNLEFIYLVRNLFPQKTFKPTLYGSISVKFIFGL